jgi:hypothetical protein
MDESTQLIDGDTISVISGQDLYLACCDCSLVHRIKVSTRGKVVKLTFHVDKRRTTRERKKYRITMTKEYE